MKYTKLGSSGLEVSRICLGCMSFGEASPGAHDWSLDEASSRPIIERALDLGINFFDTANAYSRGSSEEITGRALRDMADRDEVVIATKVYFPIRRGRNARGLSRKAIMTEVGEWFQDLRKRVALGLEVSDLLKAVQFVSWESARRKLGARAFWPASGAKRRSLGVLPRLAVLGAGLSAVTDGFPKATKWVL